MGKIYENRQFAPCLLVCLLAAMLWWALWQRGSAWSPLIVAASCLCSALMTRDQRECALCVDAMPSVLTAIALGFLSLAAWGFVF